MTEFHVDIEALSLSLILFSSNPPPPPPSTFFPQNLFYLFFAIVSELINSSTLNKLHTGRLSYQF